MWYTLFCLLFLQDISGNQLRDVSPLNSLTHLLTLKAERNLLHSAKLDEVRESGLSLRAGGRGFSPANKRVAPRLLLLENARKIEPK